MITRRLGVGFRVVLSLVNLLAVPTRKTQNSSSVAVSVQLIERRIYLIRGHKVMIDADLAELYDVSAKRSREEKSKTLS